MANNDGGLSLLAPTPGATLPITNAITLSWTAESDAPFETFSVMLADSEGNEDWYVYISSALTVTEGSGTLDPSYFVTLGPTKIHTVDIYVFTPSTSNATITYDDYITTPITSVYLAGSLVSTFATPTSTLESEPTLADGGDADASISTSGGESAGSSISSDGSAGSAGLTIGAKAGIGVGVSIALLAIVGGLFFFFCSFSVQRKKKKEPKKKPSEEEVFDRRNLPKEAHGKLTFEADGAALISQSHELEDAQRNINEIGASGQRNCGHHLDGWQNGTQAVEPGYQGYQSHARQTEIAEVNAAQGGNGTCELDGRWTGIVEAAYTPRNIHELG